jgi:hypothetical protein
MNTREIGGESQIIGTARTVVILLMSGVTIFVVQKQDSRFRSFFMPASQIV